MDNASMTLPPRPRIRGAQSVFGLVDDSAFWKVVIDLYDEDKLAAAREILNTMGDGGSGGYYLSLVQLIDAELEARAKGVRKSLSDWVDIEYIPGEQEPSIDAIGQATLQCLEAERSRFQWDGKDRVLITLLSLEKDVPWMTARFGFCAQKSEYFKICIPYHATVEPARYVSVLRHEFAHVISTSASKGRIAHWLSEGFSVFAAGELSAKSLRSFRAQPSDWLDAKTLELQFGPGLSLESSAKWLAYQQAGWIVSYLSRLKGEPSLSVLIREYADESIIRNLKLLALGETKTRDAIHHVYGLGLEELFEKAKLALGIA